MGYRRKEIAGTIPNFMIESYDMIQANEIQNPMRFNRFFFFISVLVYRITIDINYVYVINPFYEYMGFTNDFDIIRFILSIVILLFFNFYICLSINFTKFHLSDTIMIAFFLISVVPGTSLMTFIKIPSEMGILWIIYFFMLFLFNRIIPHFNIMSPKLSIKIKKSIVNWIILYFSLITLFVWAYYANYRLFFNLDVYGFRLEARTYNIPKIVSYSLAMSSVILPISIVYLLSAKKYVSMFCVMFVLLCSFSIAGSKGVLFSTVVAFVGFFIYSQNLNKYFAWLLALLSTFASLEYYILKTYNITGYLLVRVLYIPNWLHLFYYDFFSKNEYDYFRESFLRRLGYISPYSEISIPRTIGLVYYNSPIMNANNGLFSDAYANLGWIGMIIMPFLIVIVLRVLESVSKKIDKRILLIILTTVVINFISAPYFSILLGNGLIATIIFLYFIPIKERQ